MANRDHIAALGKGAAAWNVWRDGDPAFSVPDLSGANFNGSNLSGANLHRADLSGANLSKADLSKAEFNRADLRGADLSGANLSGATLGGADLNDANLSGANLSKADLSKADLSKADLGGGVDLSGANLSGANLYQANLYQANLSGADLRTARVIAANLYEADLSRANLSGVNLDGANLSGANLKDANLKDANLRAAALVDTDLRGADLTGCHIYGISAWGVKLERAKQQNLIITPPREPQITVDNIEVAQFVYLLFHNEKIRDVIDTIGKKGVLLLGRFTEGRIEILEGLRDKLRSLGFVPMVFNFDKPETKDFTETVRLLANLSRFVIVDITNPRSTPLELQAIVPDYMVPFVPILQEGQEPFAMFVDLQNRYDWVLEPVIGYSSAAGLIGVGGQDRSARRGEVQSTLGAADQATSHRKRVKES
jgi:uncharacterized protein YjbI with pentapeptide repeats